MSGELENAERVASQIRTGQRVRLSDDHKLGKVQDRTATYIMVIGGGFLRTRIYYVPYTIVAAVDGSTVLLTVAHGDPRLQEWLTPPLPDEQIADAASTVQDDQDPTERIPPTTDSPRIEGATTTVTVPRAAARQDKRSPQFAADKAPEIHATSSASPPAQGFARNDASPTSEPAEPAPRRGPESATAPEPEPLAETVAPQRASRIRQSAPPRANAADVLPSPAETGSSTDTGQKSNQTAVASTPAKSRITPAGPEADSHIDARIAELKRKLGMAVKRAEEADALPAAEPRRARVAPLVPLDSTSSSAGDQDANLAQDDAIDLDTSLFDQREDQKQAPASDPDSRRARIAADAASGVFSDAASQVKRWTAPNAQVARNAESGVLAGADDHVQKWTEPEPPEAEGVPSVRLQEARDLVDVRPPHPPNNDKSLEDESTKASEK